MPSLYQRNETVYEAHHFEGVGHQMTRYSWSQVRLQSLPGFFPLLPLRRRKVSSLVSTPMTFSLARISPPPPSCFSTFTPGCLFSLLFSPKRPSHSSFCQCEEAQDPTDTWYLDGHHVDCLATKQNTNNAVMFHSRKVRSFVEFWLRND